MLPVSLLSTYREWLDHPVVGPRITEIVDGRGGLRGRMGDLYSDDTGRDTVYSMPLADLMEFPGVPLTRADADDLMAAQH